MTIKYYHRTILNHYQKVAKSNGLAASATMDDPYVRESEIDFIYSEIERFKMEKEIAPTIMDVGCGNGYLLSLLRKDFLDSSLLGVEFTPELFDLACSRNLSETKLIKADCAGRNFFFEMADIIITERVLINILNRKDQYKAVENISKMIKPGGIFIMIESFNESLVELNQARKEMCLDPTEESYQNKYLNEGFTARFIKLRLKEFSGVMPRNFLSTHFYITRVFHKSVRPDGGRVKFSRLSKFFTEALPPGVGNYSPIQFRVFKKLENE